MAFNLLGVRSKVLEISQDTCKRGPIQKGLLWTGKETEKILGATAGTAL